MRVRQPIVIAAIGGAICWHLADEVAASGIGRWNMPSTALQAVGLGYGPGHHAPIVRAPGYPTPPSPRIVVVPRQEMPYCTAAYRPIVGCGGDGCVCQQGMAAAVLGVTDDLQSLEQGPSLGAPLAPIAAPPQNPMMIPPQPALQSPQLVPPPAVAPRVVPVPQAFPRQPMPMGQPSPAPAAQPARPVVPTPPMPRAEPLPAPPDRAAWRRAW